MAEYSYSTYLAQNKFGAKKQNRDRKVGYFYLSDNDDSAIVRFNYSSTDEFNLVDVHRFKGEYGYRNVACLRTPKDPIDKCPFCKHGEQRNSKFFVKLLEYVKDEHGNIVATPKIWERPLFFADTIASYIREYGDLRDVVFKIVRKGYKGDKKVNYDIMFMNPKMYGEENGFVKDFSGFDGLELNHHSYMERSYDEMEYFLEHGEFPKLTKEELEAKNSQKQSGFVGKSVSSAYDSGSFDDVLHEQEAIVAQVEKREPTTSGYASQPSGGYAGATDPTVSRPRRTYDYSK